MAHIHYSYRESLKLALLYTCASLAAAPFGLVGYGLTRVGVNAVLAGFITLIIALLPAALVWRTIERRFDVASIEPSQEMFSFIWFGVERGFGFTGSMTMVVVFGAPVKAECKPLNRPSDPAVYSSQSVSSFTL